MAKQSCGAREPVLVMTIILLVFIASSMVQVEAEMRVAFHNAFPYQPVNMHCKSNIGGSLGHHTLAASNGWYMFTVPGSVYSNDKYTCAFETAGKPLTYIDVFVGFGGYNNKPCYCPEGQLCVWHIQASGFSCNFDRYIRGWG